MSFLRVRKKADLPDPYIVITLGLSYPMESSRVVGKTEPYPGRWTTHIVIGSVEEIVRYNQFDKSEAEEAFMNRKIWLILCTIAIFVVFTDIETGEKYVVGYITSGVSEKIKLEKGKWYTVAGGGNLVIGPINVRIE